jgi:hypothetical protein
VYLRKAVTVGQYRQSSDRRVNLQVAVLVYCSLQIALMVHRCQILWRSLKSFRSCYSESPLQLCLVISISSNSRNLLPISTVHLLCTEKEKGGKPDRKPYPLPSGLRNPYRNLKFENSQDYAQNPKKIVQS